MQNIFYKNRDELMILNVSSIAYIQADGNYTQIVYIGGAQTVITMGLGKVEEIVRTICEAKEAESDATGSNGAGTNGGKANGDENANRFVRLGRSLIINERYLHYINVAKQKLCLFDGTRYMLNLQVSKHLLKAYKDELLNGPRK